MGTVTKSFTSYGGTSGSWIARKYRSKQAKPIDYSMPLEYYTFQEKLLYGRKGYGGGTPYYSIDARSTWQEPLWGFSTANDELFSSAGPATPWPRSGSEWNAAYSRAYSKFLEQLYERSQMMTNFAERGETVQMLTSRLTQVLKGARQLKTGDFRGFLDTFGIKPKRRHAGLRWTRPKQFAGLWLEYWFGWAPTLNDIYTATSNYGEPIENQSVKQGSAKTWTKTSNIITGAPYYGRVNGVDAGQVRVNICGRVEVTNPSLFEANRLGLVNPAATALELVPFSWFAGWFVNLQQVLSQYTDFVGLRLIDGTVSTKTVRTYSYSRLDKDGYMHDWVATYQVYGRRKVLTLPPIKLVVGLPNGLSVTRGATLASLIVQIFAPKR